MDRPRACLTPRPTSRYGELLSLTYAISLVMAYPLGDRADQYHPLRLGIVALGFYSLATLWGGIFVTTPRTFEIAFVLHSVLSGVYLIATASLLQRLLPRMKFAQFATTAGAVVCLWHIIVVPFAGTLLGPTGRDCHSIFLMSSVQGCVGLIVTAFLLRMFRKRGGDRNYIAPGDDNFMPLAAQG